MKKMMILLSLIFVFGLLSFNVSNVELPGPDEAIQMLKDGNKRYVNGESKFPHLDQARRDLTSSKGQHPFATIIGCSDSRVPVEQIFDVGIGDIFTIRVAGNVIDVDEAGSVEYGIGHLHTPVFVVLGHTSCGAVTAVAKDAELHGNIPALVDNIKPAVERAKHSHGEGFSEEMLNEAIENNVFQSIHDLFKISHEAVDLVKKGKLKVVGAIYDLHTGEVKWLGEHPDQEQLLSSE